MPTATKTKTTIPVTPLWSSPLKTTDGLDLPSKGKGVCAWIQENCVYGEGDWFGEKVQLRPWQRRFIYRLYEFYPDTGRRRYRRAVLGMAKGNGKSPIASWIGAYELLASDSASPRVIIGAASLKQANLVFGDLKTTMVESATLRPLVEPYELQVLLKDRPGVAERIAAEAGTNDGARATCFIADEVHEWLLPATSRVFMVVDGAIAKRRNAFTLGISTAGVKSESLLLSLYEHGVEVAQGSKVDDSFLFEWYEAEEGLDLDDPEQWEQAVRQANPAADDFLDVENVRHRFQTMPRFEFARYHLNRWTAAHNTWIPMETWDACGGDVVIEGGAEVWVGVDGSAKRDTTAVAVVAKDSDGNLHVSVRVFTPPPEEGQSIDPVLVTNHLRDLDRRYYVRSFNYDPHLFWPQAQTLLEEGLPMVEIPQSVGNKIDFSQALFDVVLAGRLRHGNDPELRAHAEAAVAQDRGSGWSLEKLKASRPIDALIAAAMAVQAAEQDDYGDDPGIAVFDL